MNQKSCTNANYPSLSNGGKCNNTATCTGSTNKSGCKNSGAGGCLVAPANQTISCNPIISNLCNGTNPCTVVGPPIATNSCS